MKLSCGKVLLLIFAAILSTFSASIILPVPAIFCIYKSFSPKSYKSYWSTSGATQAASTTRCQREPGWARRGGEWGLANDQLLPGITIFLISTISSYEFQNIPIFHNIFKNIPRRGKLDLANNLHLPGIPLYFNKPSLWPYFARYWENTGCFFSNCSSLFQCQNENTC